MDCLFSKIVVKDEQLNRHLAGQSQFLISADIDSNVYWIKKRMQKAEKNGAEIIHFPECA